MSLKFIEINNAGDLVCNKRIFDDLFDEETRKLPLCVLCITGIFRGGKSFFLNLVMRYLRYLARGGRRVSDRSTVPQWIKAEGRYLQGFKNNSSINRNGVGVKGGEKPVTTGIDFVKELFVIPDPQNPTRKICILLMDTQGLWDPNTDSKCNGSIFGLSCTLSSYLIFNHMGVLSSENLSQLATLTDFSSGLAKIQCQGKKAFQQLTILFRDCKDISVRYSPAEAASVISRKRQDLDTAVAYKKHTDKLRECFEGFDAMYICKPGDIDTSLYDGNLDEVNDLFFVLMGHFIEDIFMKIRPRIIGGEEVTGKTFIDYSVNFSNLFRNEDTYPDSSMIMDAACAVTNSKLIENYATEFESILRDFTKGNAPKEARELENQYNTERNKKLKLFNNECKGSMGLRTKCMRDLDYILSCIYKDIKNENDRKAVEFTRLKNEAHRKAINAYNTGMSERIPDITVSESVIESTHREVANTALEIYAAVSNNKTELVDLFKELGRLKDDLIRRRRIHIRQYGIKVIVDDDDKFNSIDTGVTEIVIAEGNLNNIEEWYLNGYTSLKSLRVENRCFSKLKEFHINNLNNLTTIDIGVSCFTHFLKRPGNNDEKSFSITNCDNLVSITIGSYSFSDYAGGFTLKYLPSLKTLKLASTNQVSCSFYNSDVTISECRKLQSIEMGGEAFGNTNYCKLENLTNLSQINMGLAAIKGRMNTATLIMTNLPSLYTIRSEGMSFLLINSLTLSNICNVSDVYILEAFRVVHSTNITNVNSALTDFYYIDKMMLDISNTIKDLGEVTLYNATLETLKEIIQRFGNYEDHSHTPAERKSFYRSICNDIIRCFNDANNQAYQIKTTSINNLPEAGLERFLYNVFSDSTYNREVDKYEREYDTMKKVHNVIINSFQRIINRY